MKQSGVRFRFLLLTLILVMLLGTTLFTGISLANEPLFMSQNVIPEVKYAHSKLTNGLEIYVFEDHQAPLVEVNLWYKVGSLDEPEGLTGISHMLEHMMYLRTETLAKNQAHELVKQVGGNNNAFTSYHVTGYYEKVPVANLELALAIEADRMRNLKFEPDEFRREHAVVQQERRWRIDSNAINSAVETIIANAFPQSSVHHQVIGWMDDIGRLTAKRVMDYYQQYYAPNNAILTVCGNVPPPKVFDLAQQYFGDYQPQTVKRNRVVEPEQRQERKLTVEKVTKVPFIVMIYQLPAGNDPDMAAIPFLLQILIDKRVKPELKHHQGLITDASSQIIQLPIPGFALVILSPVDVAQIMASESGFDTELDQLIESGISDNEFNGVKQKYLKDLLLERRDYSAFSTKVIDGVMKYDDPEYYRREIAASLAVTKEDLIRAAQKYFAKEKRTVGYIVPPGATLENQTSDEAISNGKERK